MSSIELKQTALEKIFSNLNQSQQQATFTVKGSVLVLSGAGSGKTTTIVNRIRNMVEFGNSYFSDKGELSPEDRAFLEEFLTENTQTTQTTQNVNVALTVSTSTTQTSELSENKTAEIILPEEDEIETLAQKHLGLIKDTDTEKVTNNNFNDEGEFFNTLTPEKTAMSAISVPSAPKNELPLIDIQTEKRLREILAYNPIQPWNILAITFTNKAANELKERLRRSLGDMSDDINAGTFHSICAKILRFNADKLGYTSNYTICDTDDCVRVMRSCINELGTNKKINPKAVLAQISDAKNALKTPEILTKEEETARENPNSNTYNYFQEMAVSKLYEMYQARLKNSNVMDFDDLIMNTVLLFQQFPEVLEKYQRKFRYVMVDEYQDTNLTQYMLVKLIAQSHGNICVVGDDDQSIYGWRGADIRNILEFEQHFQNVKVIRLENNYRSTLNICSAANCIIRNNTVRHEKKLQPTKNEGSKVVFFRGTDETDES
jgi:superfamily I DNA/RNA helicase